MMGGISTLSCVMIVHLGSLVLSQGCIDLGELEHGSRRKYGTGSEIEYRCNDGYSLEGHDHQVCTDHIWDPPGKPVCRRVTESTSSIKCHPPTIAHGKVIDLSSHWKEVVCDDGYKLKGPSTSRVFCGPDGNWATLSDSRDINPFPTCIRDSGKTCLPISRIPHAETSYSNSQPYSDGTRATIHCQAGYESAAISPYKYLTCSAGQWEGQVPVCGTVKRCPDPPEIPYATVADYYERRGFTEGFRVVYQCDKGYTMEDQDLAELVCHDGQWPGKLPTCALSILCDKPQAIPDGHWSRVDEGNHYNGYTYEVGTKIQYECTEGFKVLGQSLIWCQEEKTWSHIPPQCIPNTDESRYCESPRDLYHGVCTCQGQGKSYCIPFTPGMRWSCHCLEGYILDGSEVLTCGPDGQWNHDMPSCVPSNDLANDQIGTDMASSPNSEGPHISTLAIVVATACSVLGVLLLVMVAVIFRRHKPRPRLYHTTPVPPPYTRVDSNSAEEHDRVALIAYAEGRHIALPSYEEAMRGPQRVSAGSTNPAGGETGGHGLQYRPLPPVPPMLRTNPQTNPQMSGDNSNRHSTATTASTVHNRDGFSEVFGSLDTVNVSISDASTSGTVETVDSGASNPSLASRRANAGSLGSSNGSLANDDARLIETGGEGRIMSTSSEPLPEEDKEE